ncbi:MAG: fibronectin type III domain-containing protein [Thermoplasmatota archaeon]
MRTVPIALAALLLVPATSFSFAATSQSTVSWTFFTTDFESGLSGWTTATRGGSAWQLVTTKSHSPTHSATAGDGTTYQPNTDSDLVSPAIDLSKATAAKLTIFHLANGEADALFIYDYGTLSISKDNGASWTQAKTNIWNVASFTNLTIDFSSYTGFIGASQVKVKFNWVSDGSVQNQGWFVDDVKVWGTCSGCSSGPTVPGAPTGLAASGGNAQASLTWTAPASNGGSAITDYKIYRGTSAGGEAYYSHTGGANVSYTDNAAANGQTYYYKVSAVNAIGEGAQSNEASATPAGPPGAPSALTASGGNAQVSLSWGAAATNGAAITDYKIYRATASGSETYISHTGGANTSYADKGLTNGQAYFYKVSAVNSVGEGPLSNEANATPTQTVTVPGAPTSLTAAGGNARVNLTWTAPASNGGSAITDYKIYRATTSGGEAYYSHTGAANTSYADLGASNGITYYYKVSAVNSAGEGAKSAEASATPQAPSSAPTFANYRGPSSLANVNNSGEPSLGYDPNHDVGMFQAYSSTYAVTWDASKPAVATWTDKSANIVINVDPILATDRSTGRTWAGGLATACSNMFYSDDDGTSWTASANACSGATDHETIGSGPWHGTKPILATYNRAVYYCAQTSVDACSVSWDGGSTFQAPATVGGACGSLHGHVKVSADGTAYLPNAHCGGLAGGGISTNNGGAWTSYTIAGSDEPTNGFDPSVATTPDNTLYEAWQAANNHPMVSWSTNHGTSWATPVDLSSTYSPAIIASTFQAVTAGDNGRVAVAYLGSSASGDPFSQGYTGTWDLYVSYTYDAGKTWTTVKATTDPVQRGWICSGGTSCTTGRNLLDFMDANMDAKGRVLVGYADGCVDACAASGGTEGQSTSAWAFIARQSGGKGLLAAYDGKL